MTFRDEYEYEVDGQTFYVEVEGEKFEEDSYIYTEITSVLICDETGQTVDSDNEHYLEIYRDAKERDYDIELHSRDFDYYGEMGA